MSGWSPASPPGEPRHGVVNWDGRDHEVRPIPGHRAGKTYRCPGCDHEIRPATPHVVAWPVGAAGEQDRRHWHTQCWAHRGRRRPRAPRGRG